MGKHGEPGAHGRRGRTGVQLRAEVWGAAAAQTVRWSAHMCVCVLCHSTVQSDSLVPAHESADQPHPFTA